MEKEATFITHQWGTAIDGQLFITAVDPQQLQAKLLEAYSSISNHYHIDGYLRFLFQSHMHAAASTGVAAFNVQWSHATLTLGSPYQRRLQRPCLAAVAADL